MFGAHAIANADVLAALRALPDNVFDALLSDPPYGFSFMGKAWDYDVPSRELWAEALRVLKPGAPLLSFGGARTFHRVATGIEDAGFELRDCLCWLYGKGFPKSSKEGLPAGYGTALKPAWEPIILARKPKAGTMGANYAAWGTGGLAIDACRIGEKSDEGRWPANLILDEDAGALLDAHAGDRPSPKPGSVMRRTARDDVNTYNLTREAPGKVQVTYGDTGGPSRFFYCPKVSTREREYGCHLLPKRSAGEATGGRADGSIGLDNPRAGAGRIGGAHNHHPTLKPLALVQWLATLIKPPTPTATLLVPYSGAGSEMIGALQAGWPFVFGIEGEAEYVQIAEARIKAWGAR